MLFDLHSAIPDSTRKEVCKRFESHPDCLAQKAAVKIHGDRRGNNTLLHLYEKWLWTSRRHHFEEACIWCETNSLRVGDELSSGCCVSCCQGDAPDKIMLCEEEDCPAALHTFCAFPPLNCLPEEAWYCDRHDRQRSV